MKRRLELGYEGLVVMKFCCSVLRRVYMWAVYIYVWARVGLLGVSLGKQVLKDSCLR